MTCKRNWKTKHGQKIGAAGGLGCCCGCVSALGESNTGLIPGSGRDTFALLNMPLLPDRVPAGSLCYVQQSTIVKPDSTLD
jgi:hypothetical protein